MVLADTSAWIAYQRDTTSPASAALRRAIDDDSVATTDLVMIEMLSGLAPAVVDRWVALFSYAQHVPQQPWDDALSAAQIYRSCRQGGETPRSTIDCLIAAIAIRLDVAVLHDDRDYDVIARYSQLRVVRS